MGFQKRSRIGFSLLVLALGTVFCSGWSDSHEPTPAAKASFDRATSLLKDKDTAGAISELKKAIEADPEYLEAHEKYIKTVNDSIFREADYEKTEAQAVATLKAQYEDWAKRYPRSAGVEYGFGSIYSDAEDPNAKEYLLKAVALNPKLAKAYEMLSFDAERWGDEKAARNYMGKASEADPQEPSYAFYYADFFEEVDPPKYVELSLDVAKRFPNTERGAQSLYWLGANAHDDADKVRFWEQSRTDFSPAKFSWSEGSMEMLFEVYARTDPDKALALAQQMQGMVTGRDATSWSNNVTLAQNLIAVHKLLASQQYADAKALLDKSKVSAYSSNAMMLALLNAEATSLSGDNQAAYDTLSKRYAKTPEDAVHEAILKYGDKLGKSPEQVDRDVWTLRDADAKPAPPFNLGTYTSEKQASLNDYRGKVVLLTFWFPGCGPCRGEFPHFENVLKKFKGKPVSYVGINVEPSQDAYVRPFMKGTHYTFTPLRGDGKFADSVYHVRGEPTNFLIDQTGRVVYTNFRASGPESERTLELMIQSMLDHQATQ